MDAEEPEFSAGFPSSRHKIFSWNIHVVTFSRYSCEDDAVIVMALTSLKRARLSNLNLIIR